MKSTILTLALIAGVLALANAQTYLDLGMGVSDRDQPFFNTSVRKQFSDKLRAGIEIQTGIINQRFIGGKFIDEGNSTSISLPFLFKIYQDDRLRLDFYARTGMRLQSVSSSIADSRDLEDNGSFAYSFEPGMVVSLPITNRLNVQGGFTLPIIIESSPVALFENNITNVFANFGYQLSDKSILMLKANTGPGVGASGDSQKYTWSLQAGIRFLLRGKTQSTSLIIDPSY